MALSKPRVMVIEMQEVSKTDYFTAREGKRMLTPNPPAHGFLTGDGKGNVTMWVTRGGKFYRGPMGDYRMENFLHYKLREVKVQYTAILDYQGSGYLGLQAVQNNPRSMSASARK